MAFALAMSAVALPIEVSAGWGDPPEAPENLIVPATDADGTYTASWDPSTGANYYELQEKIGTGGWSTVYSGSTRSALFSKDIIEDYSYKVRACSYSNGCGDYSSTDTVSVTGGITQPAQEGTVGAVGTTAYAVDVASDGDAVISVPLRLIPGVAGFAPSISLEYDSGRGIDLLEQSMPEDTLGYGWHLAGLSQIRRCVVNQSSGASIGLDSGDSLCLDGMPLVLGSGTHLTSGAIYYTLIESYTKIEIKDNSGTIWFEAKLPDGTVQEYGNGGGSHVDYGGGVDFQWSLTKETDAHGNEIDYSYWHDPSNGVNRIASIEYSDAAVYFEYLERTDASAVSIDTDSQTQTAFLHTIRVEFDGDKVREYRLLDEVVSSRRRLNKIQHCGYNEAGTTATCLEALDLDWLTPTSSITGAPILVDGMTDGLGAVHQIEYGTILEGGSHSFVLAGSATPFGNGSLPSNTQLLSGSTNDPLRHVATKLRRDDGIGGFYDTLYAYQNVGIESTKHWGFLGFYAQRITDDESDIVTYVQYRMDYPFFGKVARLYQYDANYPSHTQTLSRSESDYAQESITHGSNGSVYPYVDMSIDFIYEGTTQLGATQSDHTLTFVSGMVDEVETTTKVATGVSEGTSGSTWGDIAPFTLSTIKHTNQTAVEFDNRTTSGKWLIGFADKVTTERWAGAASGAGIVQDATMTPQSTSLLPIEISRFPTHASLTLETDFTYAPLGMLKEVDVVGDNVTARNTYITTLTEDRYPDKVVNDKGHETEFTDYDLRFGAVKVKGDANDRGTEWDRDPFGRVTSTKNADDVVTTHTYADCPTGCGITVYGISPSYKIETTTIRLSTTIAPIRKQYFDSIGRVIRTETQSFDGSSYSKRDVKYDALGRIEKYSLPYFSGTAEDVVPTYDIRNRVTNVSRPDGGSTATTYSVSGSTVIVTVTDSVKKSDGTTSDGTQVKRSEFNILGQMTKSIDGYGSAIDPFTTYTYDANGNMLTAVVNGGSAGTTTVTFEYDDAGNQKKIVDPNMGTITKTFSALGEVLTYTDNKNQTSTYTYDTLGRIKTRVNADGTATWTWDTATNGKGKLQSRKLGTDFEEIYTYNLDSRLEDVDTKIVQIGESTLTTYTTSHTYDAHGRRSTTTYPGADFVVTRAYNARGYLSDLKDGGTAVQTIISMDAFGNVTEVDYGNGVTTERIYDPESGRLTDIDTAEGLTVFQDNDYAWRSNGTLESRVANPADGLATTREETFDYDVLNRVTLAETFINSTNTRDLSYTYNDLGNITSKTSIPTGDKDATSYVYGAGAPGPHAVTSVSIGGTSNTLTYDGNGAITKYDIAGTSDDKYIEYNVFNKPTKIVIGSSLTDSSPEAKDEFAYGPDGHRYARKTTWKDGGNTYTEKVVYIGPVEIISDDEHSNIDTVNKTQLSADVMHVKIEGTSTDEFFEYAHRDHLGAIEVVTDDNGDALDNLAFEPFGSRRKKDWSAYISTTELDNLLGLATTSTRKVRGFTGHEQLDRTGFIHMNGRVYDPALGRFLSPDPVVQSSALSQSWNRYSYTFNSPLSLTDPSGFTSEDDDPDGSGGIIDDFEAPVVEPKGPDRPYTDPTKDPDDDGGPKPSRGGSGWMVNDVMASGSFQAFEGITPGDRAENYADNSQTGYTDVRTDRWYETNGALFARDIGGGLVDAFTPVGDIKDFSTAYSNGRYWTAGAFAVVGVASYVCVGAKKACKGIVSRVLRLDACCFVAGTLVATENGLVPIEEIDEGDLVWSRDEETGETLLKVVTGLIRRHEREIWEVEIVHADGMIEIFETTDDHPWWIEGAGWFKTMELITGQQVTTKDHGLSEIRRVEHIDRIDATFNLTVADFETYFVGEYRVLVHNCDIDPNKLNHIFNKDGGRLGNLVDEFGSQEQAFQAIRGSAQELVTREGITGVFERVVRVGAQDVTVRGRVIDGVVKIGTAF